MAAVISPTDNSAASQRYAAVDHALPIWKHKLIDLSRRNNLLFFRTSKSGTLDLSQAHDEVIAEILAGKSVRFSRIFKDSDDPKLSAIARNIARKAIENREEKGLTTLYLAFGIATWPTADGGRPYEAPILLLPIKFENGGRDQSLLSIQRTGDMQFNLTLAHVLTDMYTLTIDTAMIFQEQEPEQQTTQPEAVFSRLREIASDIKDFCIENRRYISNFSFQKLAMVHDLEENAEMFAHHPIVAAIAGEAHAQALVRTGRKEIDPRSFDGQSVSQEYFILDADSSQQRVIASVLAGQNGVIQGPPGTGKSQTIANLIAVCVAHGKRVLFVAEKRAALEVVLRRLEQHHLGHIALDLHGADISRREILRHIGQSLDIVRDTQSVHADALHRSLEERRRQLDQHDLRLHEPIAPAHLSPFELRGRLLHLKHQVHSAVRWRGAQLGTITTHADTIRDLLREASEHDDIAYRTSSSPWLGAKFAPGQVQESMQTVDWIATTLPAFWQSMCEELTQLGLHTPATVAALQQHRDVHRRIQTLLERYPAELFTADVPAMTDALMPGARSHITSLWHFVINPRYRQAFLQVRSLRADRRISPWTAIAEIQEAHSICNSWKALSKKATLPQCLTTLDEVYLAALFSRIMTLGSLLVRTDLAELPIADFQHLVQGLAADVATPFRIDRLSEIERALASLGVADIYKEICEQRPIPNRWSEAFDYAWYQSCLDDSYLKFPELAHFTGRHHDTIVQEFRDQDKHHIKTNAALVAQRHAEKAIQAMNDFPLQQSVVQREAKKKARHMPLRKLLAEAPDVLTTLFPCWMASPLAVSQLIDADRRYFDIVIFDEASQVLPEDAIAAILRGTQLVVAGDKHQLPPTTFFADATMDDEETDGPDAMAGLESLLDLVSVTFAPDWYLEWHYRSRDESLIAFSNRHIYNNRLVTFPGSGGPPAVRFIECPWAPGLDGQEESASAEVSTVVDLIIEHASTSPDKSLGVITMGVKHADRIEAQLRDVRRQRNDTDSTFFDDSRPDRFFIKSIEQVQGDERDAIILSVGYGKDRSGKLKYTFGPINKEGGERRLNVAVTRARQQMTVIASFSHRDMDPERSKSRGVKFLHDYLQFAQSEGRLLGDAGLSDIPLNPFEADIFDTLRDHGLDMIPQWGVSSYRIDLAVKHPTQPGRFVLAIECDGATYHSAPTARDRDRLRQQHLEALGWRFHRIWSTDWFFRRDEEIKRTLDAYQKAVKLSNVL